MIYSVWNQVARSYDYYEAPNTQKSANTPIPSHIRSKSLGETIDQAAWPLPSSAQKVGSGKFAKGRVASRSHNLISLGAVELSQSTALLGAGVLLFAAWKVGLLKP